MTHRRSEEDQERLAAALRANLARRKAQTRERQQGDARQRQEGRAPERPGAQLQPAENPPEPTGSGGADPPGEESHDSAGFVGDKPRG
jgi:hypothetical protein